MKSLSWPEMRYRLVKFFHGERRSGTFTGDVLQFVKGRGSASLQDLYAQFVDPELVGKEKDKRMDIVRATANHLIEGRELVRVGNLYVPIVPASIMSFRFLVRVALLADMLAGITLTFGGYGYWPEVDTFFLGFCLALGMLVENAFS